MFITFTNANPAHKGKSISLNTDSIVSIHRNFATREDGTLEEVTFVHCPPHGTWEVVESVEEIFKLIKSANKSNNFSVTHKV